MPETLKLCLGSIKLLLRSSNLQRRSLNLLSHGLISRKVFGETSHSHLGGFLDCLRDCLIHGAFQTWTSSCHLMLGQDCVCRRDVLLAGPSGRVECFLCAFETAEGLAGGQVFILGGVNCSAGVLTEGLLVFHGEVRELKIAC
ncbi:hypothetical protein HG530_012605 [Fusarium avenaceum]|nr:hypothetical protein HG530_012605 [Fusarium avenaceum]